ncbi:MAG TPA: CehA/McbA family metallohydrolase [Candidatus Dormibacteraeota bacterium]|nr:CehA/McbA family metallohydrolase [Candidatus Dormibacteraeota bacterium]
MVVFLCAGIPAHAALTKDEQKCQSTAAKKGRVFFKKRLKALSKCHDSILDKKLSETTDCELEPTTMAKLDKAEQKLRDKIGQSCPDALVPGMDFGGDCLGVTSSTGLADCLVARHETESNGLIDLIYNPSREKRCSGGANVAAPCTADANCPGAVCVLSPETVGTCSGGANFDDPCTVDGQCPGAACVYSDEQRDCAKQMAKILGKLTSKRQSTLQKCKKDVAKGKLPDGTNCVTTAQADLDAELTDARTSILAACPATATAALAFGGACDELTDQTSVAACSTCAADRAVDDLILVQHGTPANGGAALLKQISNTADCVGGRLSRCRANDYLLANDRIRVVVQDIQRNLFGIGQYGGQIIDGDLVRTSGPDRDNFEEWSISLNIESTAHYTSLTILNDGSNGGPAVLRATGVDDLIDFVNPSSVVASFGFNLPASANDFDLPVTITTDYILDPGANYVRVETTVHNTSASGIDIFFGEYIGGSGQIKLFQTGYGFGEPLVTTACPPTMPNLCNYTAWSGMGDADGVSYGYMHEVPGSSTFTTSGVHVPQLKTDVLFALIGLAGPPFHIGPNGDPDDDLKLARYFIVGDGSAGSIEDTRNQIECVPTGTLTGTVTAGGNPAVRAGVAVIAPATFGPGGVSKNVFVNTNTDDNGNYSVTLPPGSYTVAANLDGSPYEGGGDTPLEHPITITAFGTTTQNIALPATGALQVAVVDENSDPSPAKVSVVGFDPSPDFIVTQSLFGLVNNRTGMFGDLEDPYPFGMAKVAWVGPTGNSGVVPLEPGNYQVYVSRGAEFSLDSTLVTITAGNTTPVSAQVERVIDSDGFVAADFHVHSIDSPDAAVTNVQRVSSMLGEGVEFFATTDHDFRANFQPTINALGASNLIGTTVGEEITSFDYGHFNAWPVIQNLSQVNNGAVDFGGAAPAGQDYPSSGFYNETPEGIIALGHADAPGSSNTVQINHVHSFFGLDGGSGLAIDTGLTPPASVVPAAARRLNPANANFFLNNDGAGPAPLSFDALEVWIGDDRAQVLTNFLGQNAGDWFNLINQGIVRTGIGDSDTHNQFVNVAGFPHNMVAMPTDDPSQLSALADTISANVNAGHSFATNGPMVRFSANAVSTGETASLELGEPTTIATTDGSVTINVDIQSPTWAEFDKVEYYINPITTRVTKTNQQTGAGAISVNRYKITPTTTQTVSPVPVAVIGTSSSRLEASTSLTLTGLMQDIWVVVMVKGTDGVSRPLYPVIGNSLKTTTNTSLAQLTDGNLGEDGIEALAFTNPLFIDVDGGGWTPPGVLVAP